MQTLELLALLIIVIFVVTRACFGPEPALFLRRLAMLVVASWLVEDSVIELYGFYTYNPEWSLFVHHVPLAIVVIWPIVIHSAWELARHLVLKGGRVGRAPQTVVVASGLFVWADASLIEPIAVASGLWRWHEPGLFEVPPIGILGWAFYAALCLLVLERSHRAERSARMEASLIVLAPLGTHLLLLVSWWGFFRWVNEPLSPWPFVAFVWAIGLGLTARSVRAHAYVHVPLRDMLTRAPAALFFFSLLWLDSASNGALVVYALAFAPPYLSLMAFGRQPPSPHLADDPSSAATNRAAGAMLER